MASTERKIPSRRLLRWSMLSIFALVISVWQVATFYTVQKYSDTLSFSPIQALVYAPKYLSANEEEEIRFAFVNPSAHPVTVTLGIENNSPLPGFLGLQESNIVYSGIVSSHQQINRQSKVFFYIAPTQLNRMHDQIPKLSLWANIDNLASEKKNLEIYLAPIPLSRSISNYLGTVLLGIVGWLLRELWEQVKNSDGNKR